MREIVIEIPVIYKNGEEQKVYVKAYVGWDFGNGNEIKQINEPMVLSDTEREKVGI